MNKFQVDNKDAHFGGCCIKPDVFWCLHQINLFFAYLIILVHLHTLLTDSFSIVDRVK